jgi:rod shape-determining protein MreD
MRVRKILLVLLGCVLLQVILPNVMGLYEALRIQLTLIAVVYFALHQDWFGAAMTGVAGGILVDLFSGGRIGIYAVSYGLIGLLIGRVQERLFKDNVVTIVTVMAGASFLSAILVLNVLSLYGMRLNYVGLFVKRVVPSGVANAIVGCMVFSMMRRRKYGRPAAGRRFYR